MDISKTISVDQKSIKDLSNVLISKQDSMDEDIDASSSNNVEKIATFLKLLLLFPNEYYEKNERPQTLYLATLIDIWSVSCTSAHPLIRTKVSLMCRSLQLRFIGYFSANSILVSKSWCLVYHGSVLLTFFSGNGFCCFGLVGFI